MNVQGDEDEDVLFDDFDDQAAMRQLEILGWSHDLLDSGCFVSAHPSIQSQGAP